MDAFEKIKLCGIIPVVVLNRAEQAIPAAKALLAGGINVMEITYRTAAASDAIAFVSQELPDMFVGAGTILTVDQLKNAVQSGSKFIVSPGLDIDLIQMAQAAGTSILPGAVTPSEIMMGLKLGITTFKFFPSENYGGLSTIKSLCAPFTDINFVPTGGITENNVTEYLKYRRIAAVGGSWMIPSLLIDEGRFDEIEERTHQAVRLLRMVRPL